MRQKICEEVTKCYRSDYFEADLSGKLLCSQCVGIPQFRLFRED